MSKKFLDSNAGVDFDVELVGFPPSQFDYNDLVYSLLGSSNKNDLIDEGIDNVSYQNDILNGNVKQCIYSSSSGDLVDACVRKLDGREGTVISIRSREMPPKPKKEKSQQTNCPKG